MSTIELPDIQHEAPANPIAIEWVGVRGLRYPVQVSCVGADRQPTIGVFALAVGLDPTERGTHMSRFVEQLAEVTDDLSPATLLKAVDRLADRLASASARIEVSFPWFFERSAPASGGTAPVDCEGLISASVSPAGPSIEVSTTTAVTSLCPCSKEISDYGAHSQRGYVKITVAADGEAVSSLLGLRLDEFVGVADRSASAPIYALLKREDEREVTMHAYDKPAFVEDIVRSVAAELAADPRFTSFSVEAENQESIHNHAAWARIVSDS
jgi:GTP cyclohydrolase I